MDLSLNLRFNLVSQATTKQLYRVMHDVELPTGLRACAPCPEVFPINGLRTPFTPEWQRLAFALNPGMTGNHFRALYGTRTAFNNGTGFPTKDGDPPKADYVNMLDLTYPLPAFDKTRFCGGATITGIEDGTDLIVDIIDGTNPAPTLESLLAYPTLYFHAVICNPKSSITGEPYITRFPQMGGGIVLVPLIGQGECRYPLAALQKVPDIADPYYFGYRRSPYVYG